MSQIAFTKDKTKDEEKVCSDFLQSFYVAIIYLVKFEPKFYPKPVISFFFVFLFNKNLCRNYLMNLRTIILKLKKVEQNV